MKHNVQRKRHLAKAFTWRIIASTTTALIAVFFGLPMSSVGAVFFADLIIKFVFYYYHDKLWHDYVTFGLNKDKGK